jgi:ferredoxin-type protein NapH
MQRTLPYPTAGNLWKSILLALPMVLLTFVFITGGQPNFKTKADLFAFFITFLFFNYLFFRMLYTGKTDRYRAAGYIALALFFALTFIVNLVKARGSMTFSNETMLACEIPFCHIVITMIVIPIALTNSIIFPGSILTGFASISSMIVIWLGVSLALGRGFCSWGCFYGGWDDGASRIMRKPKIRNINPAFKWAAFAVLLIVALFSAISLSPKYCDWLCPFKTVTEFEAVTSFKILMKTIVFLSLFASLVIILPLLTKKRIQCATFCPMGALCSLTNKVNVFDVRIDREKCNDCKLCISSCQTLSIDEKDIALGRPSVTCTKCGKCIDACKQDALHYHIKGTPVNRNHGWARALFLFPAFTLLVIFTGGTMQYGITLIIKLISTGSLF